MSGQKPVSHSDFDAKDDLPIGLLVRRHGERRLGVSHDEASALTGLQARFADQLAQQPLNSHLPLGMLQDRPGAPRRPLDAAHRTLPTWVDTAFGRFGDLHAPSLIPGAWSSQLNADLLNLWIEQELAPALKARAFSSPDAATPPRRPSATADLRPTATPHPAARRAQEARRDNLRAAMLDAVAGDTRALARLTHGTRAAELLQAAERAALPSTGTPAPRTALDHDDLRALAQHDPRLSTDAARPDFSFERATADILQAARRIARRALRQAASGATLPASAGSSAADSVSTGSVSAGSAAAGAERMARRAMLRAARLTTPDHEIDAAIDGRALALTPFAPSSLMTVPSPAGTAAPPRIAALGHDLRAAASRLIASIADSRALAAGQDPWMGLRAPADAADRDDAAHRITALTAEPLKNPARLAAFGASALKALRIHDDQRGALPRRSSQPPWRFDNNPGVLLRGLDDDPRAPRPAATSTWTADERRAAQRALAPTPPTPIVRQMAATIDDLRRPASPLAAAPLIAATPSYDAAGRGDFAALVARGLTAPLLHRPKPSPSPTATASEGLQAPDARLRATALAPAPARIQDVVISERYLPALARSVEQIGRSIDLLGRMAPAALTPMAQPPSAEGSPLAEGPRRAQRTIAIERLARASIAFAAENAELNTRAGQVADALAAFIREGYSLKAEPPARHRPGYSAHHRGVDLVSLTPEPAATASRLDPARPVEALVAQALGRERLRTVESLRQIVAPLAAARQPDQKGAAPTQGAASTSRDRALRLFSPEKTMAMLAPELESGGLLDPTSRRELAAALDALARPTDTSAAPRRVRTAFGTMTVAMTDGQLVIDTEEISSNAPGVSLRRDLQRLTHSPLEALTAPTRQTHNLALGVETGHRPLPSSATARLGRLAEGLVTAIDVHLGQSARAERLADVRLDPVDARAMIERLGHLAGGADPAAFARAINRPQALAAIRDVAAGDLVRVFAGSKQAARVATAYARSGAAALAPLTSEPAAAPRPIPAPTFTNQPAPQLDAARLGSTLGDLFARRASLIAAQPAASAAPGAARAAAPQGLRVAEALSALLSQSADARVIGALGKVALARPALGDLTRADLAHVLPFLQRDAGISRKLEALAAASTPQEARTRAETLSRSIEALVKDIPLPRAADVRGSASGWPTGESILDMGLSLGRGEAWADAPRRLGLKSIDAPNPPSASFDLSGALGGTARPLIGLGLGAGRASSVSFAEANFASASFASVGGRAAQAARSPAQAARALVSQGASVERLRQMAPLRQAAIERSLATARAAGHVPGKAPMAQTQGAVRPAALGGAILREMSAVSQILSTLSGQRDPADGGRRAGGADARVQAALIGLGVPEIEIRRASQAAASEGARAGGHAGHAGLWFPRGVERLSQSSADALLSGRGEISGALVAPSLFKSTSGSPQAASRQGAPLSGALVQPAALDAIIGGMALGLRLNSPPPSPDARQGAGVHLSVGAGGGHAGPAWMTSTTAQSGLRRLMSTLDLPTASAQPASPDQARGPQGTGGGAPLIGTEAQRRPSPGLSRTLIRRATSRTSPAVASGTTQGTPLSKRELYAPPSPSLSGGGDTPGGQIAPRAATGSPSGGVVEKAEGADRKLLAHQTGVPSQENIEDMAREVLAELKKRWNYELERRGIE